MFDLCHSTTLLTGQDRLRVRQALGQVAPGMVDRIHKVRLGVQIDWD